MQMNDRWSTSATLHYTHGHGFYDEFRYDNKLSKFGLSRTPDAYHSFVKRTDFVRKKGMTQDSTVPYSMPTTRPAAGTCSETYRRSSSPAIITAI